MTALRELIVKLGFEVDDRKLQSFERGLEDVKVLAQDVSSTITKVGAAAGVAAATLFGFAKSAADALSAVADTAWAIGTSFESFQRLRYAAQMSGSSQEDLAVGLRQLARNAQMATNANSEAAKSFQKLGISVTDAGGKLKAPDRLLLEMSDKFSKMPAGLEKTSLAAILLGDAGTKLIQTLDAGSAGITAMGDEAAALGIVFDDTTVMMGKGFNDEIDRVKAVALGIAYTIGVELIPVIQDVMKSFREWMMVNREMIKTRLAVFMDALKRVVRGTWFALIGLKNVMGALVSVVDRLLRPLGGLQTALGAILTMLGLFALGKVTMGLFAIAKAFMAIGKAAMIANLKVAAIPVLIGALVAAAFLIIEDFLAFMEGRPSVLGFLIGNWEQIYATFQNALNSALAQIRGILRNMTSAVLQFFGVPEDRAQRVAALVVSLFDLAVENIKGQFALLGELLTMALDGLGYVIRGVAAATDALMDDPAQAIKDFANLVWDTIRGAFLMTGDWIQSNFISPMAGWFSGLWDAILGGLRNTLASMQNGFQWVADKARSVGKFFGFEFEATAKQPAGTPPVAPGPIPPLLGIGPQQTIGSGGPISSTKQQTNNISVNVTVPPGSDPDLSGQMVQEALKRELDAVFFKAGSDLALDVAY